MKEKLKGCLFDCYSTPAGREAAQELVNNKAALEQWQAKVTAIKMNAHCSFWAAVETYLIPAGIITTEQVFNNDYQIQLEREEGYFIVQSDNDKRYEISEVKGLAEFLKEDDRQTDDLLEGLRSQVDTMKTANNATWDKVYNAMEAAGAKNVNRSQKGEYTLTSGRFICTVQEDDMSGRLSALLSKLF